MYAHTRQASEHHRDLLARAHEQRQGYRVLALRKAARGSRARNAVLSLLRPASCEPAVTTRPDNTW